MGHSPNKIKLAIFASGSGTNAACLMDYFANHHLARVELIVSNKRGAGVFERAAERSVQAVGLENKTFYEEPDRINALLITHGIDFVVLAGFLQKMPSLIVARYGGRMVNIHPALLPAYGGKGMYGDNVHKAVLMAKAADSGITIHYVTENYDEGAIVLQAKCSVTTNDTIESLRTKIQRMEHFWYPRAVEFLIS